jgi:hypothetical protein
MTNGPLFRGLPGESLVRDGVRDVLDGRRSIPALVVSIARGRFVRAGVLPRSAAALSAEPERDLYRLLRTGGGDAYSRYNALIRELGSFLSALEGRSKRITTASGSSRPE